MKEIMEKFEELQKMIEGKNKGSFKDCQEKMKENVNRLIDEAEEVVWCVTDKGVAGNGTPIGMICAIASGLENLIEDTHIPREIVKEFFNDAVFNDKKENDLFGKSKDMIERM